MTNLPIIRAGLVGRGIGGSASPAIHEREAAAQGTDLRYELVDFDQLGLEDRDLGDCLIRLADEGFVGVNITHPFKQAVISLLDRIDRTAEDLGAVNCVTFANGEKYGFNSDLPGFAFLLEDDMADARLGCVAQIGAGGAGSATAYALLASGVSELRLYDATVGKANSLARRLAGSFPAARIVTSPDAASALAGADGIVQATPVGMEAHPGMPFDPDLVTQDQWLADIIYFPRETELVRAVKARGVRAVGGSAMVIGQAIEPFRQFTGLEPDRQRMLADFAARDLAGLAKKGSVV